MKKMPDSPEVIFDEYIRDWQAAFGNGLEAVILYGSVVRGEFEAQDSDINFLVILQAGAMQKLRTAIPLMEKWRQHGVVAPLVLTRDFLRASLDSFPIEILSLKRQHRTLFGEDVLQDLSPAPPQLRLQLEREIKGNLIHLWKGFVSVGHDRKALHELLVRSISDFYALFETFLFLKNVPIPVTRQEVFQQVARVAGLEEGFIAPLLRLHERESRPYREELWKLTEAYITQIEKLAEYIDRM